MRRPVHLLPEAERECRWALIGTLLMVVLGCQAAKPEPPRLSACGSAVDVEKVLKEEFSSWFGADIAGRAQYKALAQDVWKLWTESRAEPGVAPDLGDM